MKASLPFRDAEGKSDSGGLLWNSGEQGAWVLLLALRSRAGLIIALCALSLLRQKRNVTPF
jgi:hypothetical protein